MAHQDTSIVTIPGLGNWRFMVDPMNWQLQRKQKPKKEGGKINWKTAGYWPRPEMAFSTILRDEVAHGGDTTLPESIRAMQGMTDQLREAVHASIAGTPNA